MTTQQENDRPETSLVLDRFGERLDRQLLAMAAWNRHAELAHRARLVTKVTSSGTAQTSPRLSAMRRTQQAVIGRASRAQDDTVDLFMRGKPLAVVVHPHPWMRGKLENGLTDVGVEVVASCEDGAEGLGVTIVEQPDIVVLDDRISSSTGLELLADLLRYSTALVAAQVGDDLVMGAMLDGGASAVFSRRVPPAVMVEAVDAMARGRATLPVQVR